MNSRKTITALAITTILAATALAADDALTQAQQAYVAGKYDVAKAKFEEVLKKDPGNALAKNYLRLINATKPKAGANQPPAGLVALKVPKIELKDATLGAALDYMKKRAAELSSDKEKVNFVLQIAPAAAEKTKITLSLNDVPYTEVLKYIGDLANVSFTYETHAIVVKPKATLKGGSTDELVNEPQ